MSEKAIINFCGECGTNSQFVKKIISEEVKVKGITIENEHEYYECLSCKELFEPFNDPDKNLVSDYRIYREKMNYLQPEEVREIREKYSLSIRDFSELLGISYSTLSNVENNYIQPAYYDSLLKMANDPYAFMQLVKTRNQSISKEKYQKLLMTLEDLCMSSYKEHEHVAVKFYDKIAEASISLKRVANVIEYDYETKMKKEEEKPVWKKSANGISSILKIL